MENSHYGNLYKKERRFRVAQIVGTLKLAELGAKVDENFGKCGVSEPTYYKLKSQFSGVTVSHLARRRLLHNENAKFKCLCSDSTAPGIEEVPSSSLKIPRNLHEYWPAGVMSGAQNSQFELP